MNNSRNPLSVRQHTMTVAEDLGAFVATASYSDLGSCINTHCIRALIDWTGATIAGWRADPTVMVAAAIRDEYDSGPAQLLRAGGSAAPARVAALLNGCASHVVELDDIYSPGLYHPGSPTIASALAAAQAAGADGRTLLVAIAVGYQVGNAIAKAIQPAHYRLWHTTGTAGCFGAAAAAAVALRLTAEQAGHALATSATMAAGLQQAFRSDSMSKPLHAGRAAEAGIFAALCAAQGVTAEKHMFEGPRGFGRAMSEHVDWTRMLDDLRAPWTVAQTTHKIHACCGHNFSAIDGALILRAAIGDTPIRQIRVETYSTAIEVAGIKVPDTAFEAKFSIPFTVATALVFDGVGLDAFTPARLADPVLRALASRTEMIPSAAFDAEYPAMRNARTIVHLADGRVLTHHQPTRRGSPTYPLSDGELHAKFSGLSEPVLGAATSNALLQQLLDIRDAPDCRLPLTSPTPTDARYLTALSA